MQGIRIPFYNEMWIWTIDPFVGIPVFIAKRSMRQDCWRVMEDFHSQENIQFFDIHNCLFMRLHFSIGGYDYRRTARFRQSIHFSITQVLLADHMHRRAGVDNKFSFLKFKSWCRKAPIFRKWEECCSFMVTQELLPLLVNPKKVTSSCVQTLSLTNLLVTRTDLLSEVCESRALRWKTLQWRESCIFHCTGSSEYWMWLRSAIRPNQDPPSGLAQFAPNSVTSKSR